MKTRQVKLTQRKEKKYVPANDYLKEYGLEMALNQAFLL